MRKFALIFLVCCFLSTALPIVAQEDSTGNSDPSWSDLPHRWWSDAVAEQLKRSGDHRPEMVKALNRIEKEFRPGMMFLFENMPARDLTSLDPEMLVANVRLAYQARAAAPWSEDIPEEIFLNDIVPYVNVDEPRENWRQQLREISWPIVKDCQSASEAAQKLNEQLFKKVGVKYSTGRKRANQAPNESIAQGLASCTGLSILLADACRSVGVPARLAGIPSWPNKRGNHTWVEIWDGQWHFTGAAEPDPKGLNHTWFQGDAALAKKESRLNAIYAVSFKRTETTFPLVWSSTRENPIYAINVTDRYTQGTPQPETPQDTTQAMFRVWNEGKTERVVASIRLTSTTDPDQTFAGKSRDNEADMNDMLSFPLKRNHVYQLEIDSHGYQATHEFKTGDEPTQLVELVLRREESGEHDSPFSEQQLAQIRSTAKRLFDAPAETWEDIDVPESLDSLLRDQADAVRQVVWQSYLENPVSQTRKADFEKNQVTFQKHLSPYTVKEVGTRPKNGWPLFIAMHGGGNAPQRVNDRQWKHMQVYYKDQAEVTGYKYLALRAPNNTWNGFYDNYVYPLIENLVRQFIVHGDIDPNKVFLMGYSHGGYGAFAIGPKIPYRFAAIHSSAAAPTDGETSAKTLRNTRFTFMAGEKDTAYGRAERCQKFAEQIKQLKNESPSDYPVEFLFQQGFGHGGLPDRDMIKPMYPHVRNVTPTHLTWELTDPVVDHFFWLSVDKPAKKALVDAKLTDNTLEISTRDCSQVTVWLDPRLIDPEKKIAIRIDGSETVYVEYEPQFRWLCESIRQSGDPNLAFDFRFNVEIQD